MLLALRGPLQLFANVRPVRTFPGTHCALRDADDKDIDWIIIRENSEGEYAGQGGRTHLKQEWETATEVAIFTRKGIERIMRFAFETARSRPRKFLTVVTKSNSMRNGMVLWDEVALEVSKDFPDVKWDKMLVDAMTVRMVGKPKSLDTIVGTNLHMDIVSRWRSWDTFRLLTLQPDFGFGCRFGRVDWCGTIFEFGPDKEESFHLRACPWKCV